MTPSSPRRTASKSVDGNRARAGAAHPATATYPKDKDQLYGYGGDNQDGADSRTRYSWCCVDAETEASDACGKVEVR